MVRAVTRTCRTKGRSDSAAAPILKEAAQPATFESIEMLRRSEQTMAAMLSGEQLEMVADAVTSMQTLEFILDRALFKVGRRGPGDVPNQACLFLASLKGSSTPIPSAR